MQQNLEILVTRERRNTSTIKELNNTVKELLDNKTDTEDNSIQEIQKLITQLKAKNHTIVSLQQDIKTLEINERKNTDKIRELRKAIRELENEKTEIEYKLVEGD